MIYRPSARVELRLRTEEFNDTELLESRLGAFDERNPYAPELDPTLLPAQNRARADQQLLENQQARQDLELRRRAGQITQPEFEIERARINSARTQIQSSTQAVPDDGRRPRSFESPVNDDLSAIGNIEPISIQIERNGLATADTATIVLDYIDAPFDPRILRACGVEATIGVVPASGFEAGVSRDERRGDGSLLSQVGRRNDGTLIGSTRFVGFVDDWAVKYAEEGDTVTLECRDMSAPLRDLKINPGDSIDLSLPLDQGVSAFLNSISPATAGITVRFEGEGAAPAPGDAGLVRKRPRRGRVRRRGRRGDQDMTLWDHITDVCRAVGFIPIVDGFDIRIVEARTLFSSEGAQRMIYGQNLSELNFTRRLQGLKVPTIEVRAYDSDLGRTRWARFPTRGGERASGVLGVDNPPRALRANEVTPSGANPTESIRVIQVSGIVEPATLERIARNAFEQIGRQEIEGDLTTYDVDSYDSPGAADLLDVNAGDAIEVLIVSAVPPELSEDGPSTTLAQLQALTRARREEYLVGLGWGRTLARRFAALQDATSFQTTFRVQDVNLSWDYEDGVKIVLGFINYVTVREDS